MDNILITPDGTIWLATTFSRSDNEANPPGALVWALGQPETYLYVNPDGTQTVVESQIVSSKDGASIPTLEMQQRHSVVRLAEGGRGCWGGQGEVGVTCRDPSGQRTRYLRYTPINAIAMAPDGSVWVVGGYDGDNGGLCSITFD